MGTRDASRGPSLRHHPTEDSMSKDARPTSGSPDADAGADLIELVERLGQPRVLVVGDLMLDRYVWGDAERISQEAPVILFHADQREERLGGGRRGGAPPPPPRRPGRPGGGGGPRAPRGPP